MVSFSCDHCQNVFTKPRIGTHLQACRSPTVSCIDCGTVFDRRTVRSHKSCISESEKYGPRRTKSDDTFCVNCQLKLNGAVHAKQHYDSKKHRAKLRRDKQSVSRQQVQDGACTKRGDRNINGRCTSKQLPGTRGVKKVIIKVLKKAPNRTLHINILLARVAEQVGLPSSLKLSALVTSKVHASSRFGISNEDVTLRRRSKQMKRK
eukprot:TRINITY_DN167_c0_g1_i2.p1 TRINITY_DN167_c0_g1~~TRINITY_DN167_c0_g1_i2.p1  ORF type:complete len:206 (-),score=27.89 TRINITY_DN167_c0_g1_i2:3288-3905(-)